MPTFPAVDPIPLPAPIWLFKLLHIVTLSLHFVAVQMLIGGLLVAIVLSLFRGSPSASVAARALARRLTVVMTFVINMGVPPLLFSQVLYGRALYASSVLIGIYWISIVLILMLLYRMLYRFTELLNEGRTAWPAGLLAWLLAGCVARLFSTNMTLMLRPEVWQQMYSASAMGRFLPPPDPTLTPRWLLMIAGGMFISGLWLIYLSARKTFTSEEQKYLAGLGGKLAAGFGVVYLAAGFWASGVQPAVVKDGLAHDALYHFAGLAGYGWLALVAVAIVFGLAAVFSRLAKGAMATTAILLAVLIEILFVVYRDGVRDLTLLSKGFNVWDRAVATNWSVVGIFLVLFVAAIGVIGWLVSVVARAKKPMEGAA